MARHRQEKERGNETGKVAVLLGGVKPAKRHLFVFLGFEAIAAFRSVALSLL